jgi:hypothetical protein
LSSPILLIEANVGAFFLLKFNIWPITDLPPQYQQVIASCLEKNSICSRNIWNIVCYFLATQLRNWAHTLIQAVELFMLRL